MRITKYFERSMFDPNEWFEISEQEFASMVIDHYNVYSISRIDCNTLVFSLNGIEIYKRVYLKG